MDEEIDVMKIMKIRLTPTQSKIFVIVVLIIAVFLLCRSFYILGMFKVCDNMNENLMMDGTCMSDEEIEREIEKQENPFGFVSLYNGTVGGD